MAEAHDICQILIQNLEDAGLKPADVKQCFELWKRGETNAVLRILGAHRRALLHDLHQQQKQIDCLDYLTHKMNKQGGKHHG